MARDVKHMANTYDHGCVRWCAVSAPLCNRYSTERDHTGEQGPLVSASPINHVKKPPSLLIFIATGFPVNFFFFFLKFLHHHQPPLSFTPPLPNH